MTLGKQRAESEIVKASLNVFDPWARTVKKIQVF